MGFLDRIDSFYYSRSKSEAYLASIIVGLAVGGLVYLLLAEPAQKYKENQESINKKLHSDINKAKNYLDSITVNGDREYKVKQLNKKIKEANNEINQFRMKLNKITMVMKKELSPVLYTKHNWSSFLNEITNQAKRDGLKMYALTNSSPKESNSTFGKVLNIGIKAQGEYGNILSFVNDLEKSKLVTTIDQLKLKSTKGEPIVDINMSVWGVKP